MLMLMSLVHFFLFSSTSKHKRPEKPFFSLAVLELHGDMGVLCHAEEQEADFFYNITHIQSHRKMRALNRLCAVLQRGPKEHADQTDRLTPASVVHFLLPMTLHFVYECVKRDDRSLQEEAVISLQHLARVLPWSHYYRNLHSIIMQIGTARYEANEKALMRAVSSVIDGFHFNILHHVEPAALEEGEEGLDAIADPGAAADDKMNTIVKTVSTRLVPALKNLVISTGMCSVLVMWSVLLLLFPLRILTFFFGTHIVAPPQIIHTHTHASYAERKRWGKDVASSDCACSCKASRPFAGRQISRKFAPALA
jgi:hypothetical protein